MHAIFKRISDIYFPPPVKRIQILHLPSEWRLNDDWQFACQHELTREQEIEVDSAATGEHSTYHKTVTICEDCQDEI